MNDATRRLERINPVPGALAPPPLQPLLARLEDLPALAPRSNDRTRRVRIVRRWRGRWAGAFALAASLLVVAAVVAVIAIHAHSTDTSAVGSSTLTRGTRAALVQTLGVLRRPQTKAERATHVPEVLGGGPAHRDPGGRLGRLQMLGRWGYPRVQQSLIRSVALPDGRLTILPLTYRPFVGKLQRAEGVSLQIARGSSLSEIQLPVSVATLNKRGANIFDFENGHNIGGIVVPDGIARVQLDSFRVQDGQSTTPTGILRTTAAVHDNVAVFSLPAPTVPSHQRSFGHGMASSAATVQMTWYRIDGTIATRAHISIVFNWFRSPAK